MVLDAVIIGVYLLIINVIGVLSVKAKNMKDYFLGDNRISWPVACLSIVATETSTLTFISVPGLAYVSGLGFLQIAAGYIIGRIVVAIFFIPRYYRGQLSTVYEFLQLHFGTTPRVIVSVLFHIIRLLSDAIRLFATAIPLAFLIGWGGDYRLAIIIIGATTVVYTLTGGIGAVVITDAIQFILYLSSAVVAVIFTCHIMDTSFLDMFTKIPPEQLMVITGLDSGFWGLFKGYNPISGLLCGALLSIASHGTDHMMVQRVLSCKDETGAKKAMVWSGIIVFFQMALFLLLGLFIMVLFEGRFFDKPDEIMPEFIIGSIPSGLRGLMLAGLFSAAMSSLSSTINSLSASTAMDILRIDKRIESEKKQLTVSRCISFFWMIIIVLIALSLNDSKSPLVELGLGIASLVYGGMLAIFFQARFSEKVSSVAAISGMITGIIVTLAVSIVFDVFWTWNIPIGFVTALVVSMFVDKIRMIIKTTFLKE